MAYTRLDPAQKQIRLLHLEPALDDQDPIRCSFSVASFEEEINYEALSYAWGDVTPIMPIILEGREILITKNLHSALSHLRYKDRERVLWADALCINQIDLSERTHQIGLMSAIYSTATMVVAWLGEAWQGCELAMEVFVQLGRDESLHPWKSPSSTLSVHDMDLDSIELQHHFFRFFASPWWKRLWTVQEHTLAKLIVFQYGKHILPGELVLKTRKTIWKHANTCCTHVAVREDFNSMYRNLTTCIDRVTSLYLVQTTRHTRSFIYWVSLFSSREVSDPRDKIYGILGLASGVDVGLVEPDYTRSLQEVYHATVVASIERTRNLDIFSYLISHRTLQLPSFVPDFHNKRQPEMFNLRLLALDLYSASGDTLATVEVVAPGNLRMRGLLFDRVFDIGTPVHHIYHMLISGKLGDLVDEVRRLINMDHPPGSSYEHTQEPRETAMWATICGGLETYWEDGSALPRRLRDLNDLSRFQRWESWIRTPDPRRENSLFTPEFLRTNTLFRAVTLDRRLIVTEKGYIGFAPDKCEKGDFVAILAGGKVPYMLRRETPLDPSVDEGDPKPGYSILGDAYVHGVMDGELVKELEEKGEEMEEIMLV